MSQNNILFIGLGNLGSALSIKIAEANNIIYVENKCTKIEIEKYLN